MKTIEERFFDKVEKTESCWIWKAHKIKKGYGHFHYIQKDMLAHRYSYMIHKGNIPEGMYVLHKCDNRACVNPDHLFLGSMKDNCDDAIHKKRQKYFGFKEPAKGELVITAKLSEKQVLEIRDLRDKGLTVKKLSEKFNVYWMTIHNIIHRKSWKHI